MDMIVSFKAKRDLFNEYNVGRVIFLNEASEKDIENAEILFTFRFEDEVSDENFRKMKNLKIVQSLLAGVDYLPFEKLKGKVILKNSGALSWIIAEHVFAMILSASRNIVLRTLHMRDGLFEQLEPGDTIRGKTMLIIGYGSIGREVAKIARCFNMKILAIGRSGKCDECEKFGNLEKLHEFLPLADIVVISIPLTKETKNLIGKRELELMKKNAIIVNVARGKIIDQEALYHHLLNNKEMKACLDVWWKYPRLNEKFKQDYPFEKLDNVIMTPHQAGIYKDYFDDMVRSGVRNILNYLKGNRENVVKIEDYL